MCRSVAALLAALALAGCSREEEAELPAACRLGADAVVSALSSAPGEVRLEGDTALSDCLARESEQADVLLVGEVYISAASRLADAGEALRLGYLLGAAQRGAGQTQGIHDELVRRLEQETGRVDDEQALRRGERAGLESG
ncbi:MAG: hypothetical protein WD844_00385 [Thermoleophilaceae bacterium]